MTLPELVARANKVSLQEICYSSAAAAAASGLLPGVSKSGGRYLVAPGMEGAALAALLARPTRLRVRRVGDAS